MREAQILIEIPRFHDQSSFEVLEFHMVAVEHGLQS